MANAVRVAALRALMRKRCAQIVCSQCTYSKTVQQIAFGTTSYVEKLDSGNPSVNISESCVKKLKNVAAESMLRVTVDGGGCSGFQYKFELDSTVNDDDKVFERDGAKVIIDEVSLEYLNGATVDYHEELIRSAFRVMNNPKAEQGCSCGASFSVKL